jgi:predicted nucleotide-binding protein
LRLAKTTALRIKEYLKLGLGLDVTDWGIDFRNGKVILSEIQAAALSCKYSVFLFTPDDTLEAETGEKYKVPRANVVFEAGYFMNSHGPKRTVIIVQESTRVPSDYGGHIYLPLKDRDDISPIKERLREIFKEDLP